MISSNWYFPFGEDLEKTSASNAYVETFKDNKIESLAREIIQNSLDAKNKELGADHPVKVAFNMVEIPTETVPGFQDFLTQFIPEAEKTWPNEAKTKKLLDKMKDVLNQDTISVLKISDFNTTGLEKENWESLIEQAGSSVKANDESGGSFGIGKAAPFAVSDLRMVFYNTMNSNHTQQSIGVTKFVSFDLENGTTTQGTGYYAENKKTPFDHGVAFETEPRTERGTDIYIMGFDAMDEIDWQQRLSYAVLDSFLVSLYREQVEVMIDGKVINRNNISDYLEEIQSVKRHAKKYKDLIAYYGVLTDPEHVVVEMPAYAEYDIEEGEAVLVMSNKGENNRRALMTRSAGMKIFDQKGLPSVLQFSAIFMATGKHINKELKQLENPNHDAWSSDRGDNKVKANRFLMFIRTWVRNTIKEEYEEKMEDIVDAFGVADFLPSDLDAAKNGGEAETAKKPKPVMKAKPKVETESGKTNVRGKDDEGDPKDPIADVEGSGGGGHDDDYTDKKSGGGQGGGTEFGGEGPDGGKTYRTRISQMTYRLIEMNAQKGEYGLLLKPTESIKDVRVGILMVGDNGRADKVQVISATTAGQALRKHGGNIYLSELVQGKFTRVDLVIDSKQRLKMEVEVDADL